MGRPVPIRAGVGASIPAKGNFLRQRCFLSCKQGGFPLAPLHPLRIATQSNRTLHGAASPSPAPESARHAPLGAGGMRLRAHQRAFRSPFGNLRTVVGEKLTGYKYSGKKAGGIPLAPCTPSGSRCLHGTGYTHAGAPKGFPQDKPSSHPEPKSAAHTARPIFLFFFKRNAQVIIFLRCVLKNPLQPGQISLHLSLAATRQHHDQR